MIKTRIYLVSGSHVDVQEPFDEIKDVKVYDRDGRTICWISGTVKDRYAVYDAEELTAAERKAIDAYAGLPTGTEAEATDAD